MIERRTSRSWSIDELALGDPACELRGMRMSDGIKSDIDQSKITVMKRLRLRHAGIRCISAFRCQFP